jgi:glucose/arabinose dehydrogenase
VVIALGAAGAVVAVPAQAAPTSGARLVRVGTFRVPVDVAAPPGDRRHLFVIERDGKIKVLVNGRPRSKPFLDLSSAISITSPNAGLLSLAFAPDYRRTRRFYVFLTERAGVRVKEFRRSRNSEERADPRGRNVLFQREPFRETEHLGGQLLFGPDRLLYIGIGDGDVGGFHGDLPQGSPAALRLNTLLGKIVRIDPRRQGRRPYRIPPTNPFVTRAGARPEIFAYGLRNPWRFSFDPRSGGLIAADVGHGAWEEVNYVSSSRARGADFGWPAFEGRHAFDLAQRAPRAIMPVIEYPHATRPEDPHRICSGSVIGGYVVRDRSLRTLYGRYIYGDYCLGYLRSFRPTAPQRTDAPITGLHIPGLHSFGEDGRGRMYLVLGAERLGFPPAGESGGVYRFVAR